MNCSCKRNKWAERGSYNTRVPDCQATDCVMEIKDRERVNRCMSVTLCFEVVHNNITPICFLSMWNGFARSEFYLHLTTRYQEYNTANCIWFPFWKVSLQFYGKAYFLFFLLACYFLSLSQCMLRRNTLKVSSVC